MLQEFRQFLEDVKGCRSAVDYPPSFYYKKLMRIFPEAKIILSVRNPETWRKSVMESVMYGLESSRSFPMSIAKYVIGMAGKLRVFTE